MNANSPEIVCRNRRPSRGKRKRNDRNRPKVFRTPSASAVLSREILPEHFVDHVQPLGSGYAPKKAHHNVAERLGHRDLGRVIGRGRSEDRRNGCDQDRSGELDVDIGKEKTVGNALPKFLLQSLGPLAMALGRDASVNFRIETLLKFILTVTEFSQSSSRSMNSSMTLRAEAIRASYLRSCRL